MSDFAFRDSGTIAVPFCPSKLSGVAHTDFIETMWYHRRISIPAAWAGKRVILHFGGVDYECEAFIDGVSVGRHWGNTVAFNFDVTTYVTAGATHDLVVYVRDEVRSGVQPAATVPCPIDPTAASTPVPRGSQRTVWMGNGT